MPPYRLPPTAAAVAKPRNRVAAVALILALLGWLAAALSIWLISASHAWTSGCLVDKPLLNAGTLCSLLGGLLNIGAAVTALIRLVKPRARGGAIAMGAVAMVMGAVGAIVCLLLFATEMSPHAISPVYLHAC
jgi:hypothetical protein